MLKGENASLPAFFPFPTLPAFSPFPTKFSKGLYPAVIKTQNCVVKG